MGVEFADNVVDGKSNNSKIRFDSNKGKTNKLANVKKYGAHIGLFLALVVYTALGALVSNKSNNLLISIN